MPNLIDISYFFGSLEVAQKGETSVITDLNAFISDKEPEFMQQLLGYPLYQEFVAGLGTPTAKWTQLDTGYTYTVNGVQHRWNGFRYTFGSLKKSPIANYVYWYYSQSLVTIATGTGQKQVQAQNAINASANDKNVKAWNEMVKQCYACVHYLLYGGTEYGYTQDACQEIFKYKNTLGL